MIDISFSVECERQEELAELIKSCAEYVLKHEKVSGSVNITVVSEQEIQRINREFRNIDRVTDVLSFPAWDDCAEIGDGFIGDIAICEKRAEEQAKEYNHSLRREVAFLTIHGMLHILGYDHIEPDDEKEMFALQDEILSELGIGRN